MNILRVKLPIFSALLLLLLSSCMPSPARAIILTYKSTGLCEGLKLTNKSGYSLDFIDSSDQNNRFSIYSGQSKILLSNSKTQKYVVHIGYATVSGTYSIKVNAQCLASRSEIEAVIGKNQDLDITEDATQSSGLVLTVF